MLKGYIFALLVVGVSSQSTVTTTMSIHGAQNSTSPGTYMRTHSNDSVTRAPTNGWNGTRYQNTTTWPRSYNGTTYPSWWNGTRYQNTTTWPRPYNGTTYPSWWNGTRYQNTTTWPRPYNGTTYPSWRNGTWYKTTTPMSFYNRTDSWTHYWQNGTWRTLPRNESAGHGVTHPYNFTTVSPYITSSPKSESVFCYSCLANSTNSTCRENQYGWDQSSYCTSGYCVVYGDENEHFERRCATETESDDFCREGEERCKWWFLPGTYKRACRCCCDGNLCNDLNKENYNTCTGRLMASGGSVPSLSFFMVILSAWSIFFS